MVHIIGHRGGRNLWPENSLSGFRNLAQMPVDGVEFDIHLTRSGEMLVIHDPTLERTTDARGPVADLGAGKHREVNLKDSDGEAIPTLEEVLAVFKNTPLELHIELKTHADGTPYGGLAAKAFAAVERLGLTERSILTSFHSEVLADIRKAAPGIRTLSSFDAKSAESLGLASGLSLMKQCSDIIAVEKSLLQAQWEEITRLVPLDRLGAWVPNETSDLEYWLAKPIRQITTDRPDLALQARR
ncbi:MULTISPECIES: glycerophosphodiester phosphodiesterase family protein [Rhizobium]|uniref:glycerophosphodiester phosphodiesterase family protein n=1 Tax=Rhizobium phaseoli TaxID=396 RepID=UPI000202EEA1|nr:glycerophosphodiester phosphodiesterase family protein [Rhizobium phaseoli]EGE61613.1 glycerophosphoryl diester phosphodiesterase protein [Rhizobium etli CNPAF512]KEC73709.1 glycerophosphoryl diester phosphodiesterase [Rhizobium leguminosarum bv. phaseoli CCGM1]ANL34956.1 glycerophosphoryl diester phosphodiesterase protein [Rhizobium phaseoli]ANL98679.1 glycerophosphoryl diester phosphodiesterase protein [Rhizobium phaseoli]PDS32416.1 glycerophosphodiester phosphodiesterase [Rhizobium phase